MIPLQVRYQHSAFCVAFTKPLEVILSFVRLFVALSNDRFQLGAQLHRNRHALNEREYMRGRLDAPCQDTQCIQKK